ncbi:MAG: LysM peptidoglycan-binding domain-containing protein [Acidimicrobiales bacterium]
MRTDVRSLQASRRYTIIGAFAAVLAACAVWVQVGAGPGVADRPGSGPLAALGAGPSLAASHVWLVQPGDTVWAIARRLQPHGDVRPLVDELSAQLHGASLQVGQHLVVP